MWWKAYKEAMASFKTSNKGLNTLSKWMLSAIGFFAVDFLSVRCVSGDATSVATRRPALLSQTRRTNSPAFPCGFAFLSRPWCKIARISPSLCAAVGDSAGARAASLG